MTSVAILVICGSLQLLCALSSLLINLRSNEEKIMNAFDLDFVAIFMYAINGILLLSLIQRKKNMWWVIPLLANISTAISLLAAGVLVVMALLAIQNHPPRFEGLVLLANSLLMLIVTLVSTKTVCALWFCSGDRDDMDVEALVNLHVLIDDNDGVEHNKIIYRSK